MRTIKQHQGGEMSFFYQSCLTVNIFETLTMNNDGLEPTVPSASCSLLKQPIRTQCQSLL